MQKFLKRNEKTWFVSGNFEIWDTVFRRLYHFAYSINLSTQSLTAASKL